MIDLNGQSNLSVLSPSDWDCLLTELQDLIAGTGRALDGDDTTQLAQSYQDYVARARFLTDINLFTDPNRAVLMATPLSKGVYNQPINGERISWRPLTANTGALTLVVFPSGGPPRSVRTEADVLLTGGEISLTADSTVRYDSATSHWFLIGA